MQPTLSFSDLFTWQNLSKVELFWGPKWNMNQEAPLDPGVSINPANILKLSEFSYFLFSPIFAPFLALTPPQIT